MSIFFFRSALGRSDLEHINYSSTIIYILAIYIFIKYYMHPFIRENRFLIKNLAIGTLIIISLFTSFGILRIYAFDGFENNFPYTKEDSDFIRDDNKRTISFIKKNLGKYDNFFTMTSEAIWYYYINKPSPTKFPVIWFASPNLYQEQVVSDLKNNNVKIILYSNDVGSNIMDQITNKERFPIIDNYLRNNYSFFTIIDNNVLWIKIPK
jgi:hypothetical protein